MKKKNIIYIPTLNDYPHCFETLLSMYSDVNSDVRDVVFDFSNCDFLRPNAVAFLGGLARLIESQSRDVQFNWNTCTNDAVMTNLCQNGFAETFQHSQAGWSGESIPYREDISLEVDTILDYLTDAWLGRGRLHFSKKLRCSIVGSVWEIYNNAFEHSKTGIGVFSCGQHFYRHNQLILSVIDFGVGIPDQVRTFFRHKGVDNARVEKISSAKCLEWAFKKGNTTSSSKTARGIGLDLFKKFIQVNNGKLEIYSNDSYVIINKEGEQYQNRDRSFGGTIVHITLQCDERIYKFKNESLSP